MSITETSLKVFLAYAKDSKNWAGMSPIGVHVGGSKEERGNLTQLKKAGLITTMNSDRHDWIIFTAAGRKLAAKHGIEID